MPEKVGYAVVDVETTGLYTSDSIIEVGVVLLDPSRNITAAYDTLINPARPIEAVDIHQITNTLVVGAPSIEEITLELSHLFEGRKLVAHNAPFDANFLEEAFRKSGISISLNNFVDTLRLSRKALPNLHNHKLTTLAKHFGIPYDKAHGAVYDAIVTAAVFKRLIEDPSVRRLTYQSKAFCSNVQLDEEPMFELWRSRFEEDSLNPFRVTSKVFPS